MFIPCFLLSFTVLAKAVDPGKKLSELSTPDLNIIPRIIPLPNDYLLLLLTAEPGGNL
ncbi:MAG: hypothetical protein WBK70_03000 [Thermacetogeniaceae bacterium]|jgi:hypothetical protein